MAKSKPTASPKLVATQDPDNPHTTILSRWPTEEEKKQTIADSEATIIKQNKP